MRRHRIGLALACPLALVIGWGFVRAAEGPKAEESKPEGGRKASAWTTAVEPKPLSDHVKKGLAWLAEHQGPSGGWGQGEEAPNMRQAQPGRATTVAEAPNVADTCIAALALIRSGSSPTSGPYRDAVAKAVRFVEQSVESSDSQSIAVTTVQGTRVQQKLGPNIDTFLASLLLAEVKGRMGDSAEDRRLTAALDRVVDKIKRHQKEDGSFEGQGWAPVLAQALCGKAVNRAAQNGVNVPATVLARAENGAKLAAGGFAMSTAPAVAAAAPTAGPVPSGAKVATTSRGPSRAMGAMMGGAGMRGDAGVELYSRAASLGVLQDSANTLQAEAQQLRQAARSASKPEDRDRANRRLGEIADTVKVQKEAQAQVIDRLADKGFVSGFGSNGGEEFLSYMNIAESLVVKGGDEWTKWDKSMTANLDRIQNDDGSWTGHHCITGRTFCTSSALLVLLADRTPVPTTAKEGGKSTAGAAR